jgi:endonuclease V-like protein UPF0215 family
MRPDAHKKGVRVLAVASGPVEGKKRALVVGIVQRELTIEGVLSTTVEVDGTDSSYRIAEMLRKSRFRQQVKIVVFDGIALAGLNLIDPKRISKSLGVDVLIITRRKPRKRALVNALKKYSEASGKGVDGRLEVLEGSDALAGYAWAGLHVKTTAKTVEGEGLTNSAFEALRLAHIVARGVSSGESKGRV